MKKKRKKKRKSRNDPIQTTHHDSNQNIKLSTSGKAC